jgi:DNA-binding XRE family transcriptional regulator
MFIPPKLYPVFAIPVHTGARRLHQFMCHVLYVHKLIDRHEFTAYDLLCQFVNHFCKPTSEEVTMIGKRLKQARGALGLSLRGMETAIQNQVSAQAIGKYERDEMMPSSTILLALARALNVTPECRLPKGAAGRS